MRKQPIIIVLVAVIVIALGVITYAVYKSTQNNQPDSANLSSAAAKEEALEEARAFTPPEGTMCTQVMTPAVHQETGVTHTFTSGCLPDGWEKDDSSSQSLDARDQNHDRDSDSHASDGSTDADSDTNRRDDAARSGSSATKSEIQPSNSAGSTGSRGNISPEERALREARSYRPAPDTMCTQVLTPATHKATGVKYTFPTGCIPEGWVRDSDRTPRFRQ